MNTIKRSALVSYSARQMFELVNNIADYPRFLPWCGSSRIISQDEKMIEAELTIVWNGIHKSFVTRNILHPYDSMEIELVSGPFKHLEGHWRFQALDEHACKVIVELQFEFTGSILDRFFEPIFSNIANSLVDAFCKRAGELYGHHKKNSG